MNFKKSSFYVQQKINNLLRAFRIFARAYINDIVMFNHTLKKYLIHLNQIFRFYEFYDINFFFKKFFFDNFTITLFVKIVIKNYRSWDVRVNLLNSFSRAHVACRMSQINFRWCQINWYFSFVAVMLRCFRIFRKSTFNFNIFK